MYAEKYGLILHERIFEAQEDIFGGFGRSIVCLPNHNPGKPGKTAGCKLQDCEQIPGRACKRQSVAGKLRWQVLPLY